MAPARQRIIDAALTLVSEQGLSRVTMIEIARTANVSRQTLYNHFPDIPSILTEAAAHHNAAATAGLEQALAVVQAPSDKIRQIVIHVAAISTHGGHTLQSHAALPPDLREQLSGFDEALEQQLRRALHDGVEQGEFSADLTVETDAVLLRHALGGLSELVAASPDDAADLVAETARTVLAALR
ncbi:MAG: TetR/AcrR family transcriptional regulator [Acidimicrobiales bacterium]